MIGRFYRLKLSEFKETNSRLHFFRFIFVPILFWSSLRFPENLMSFLIHINVEIKRVQIQILR